MRGIYERAKYDKNRRRRINDKTNPFLMGTLFAAQLMVDQGAEDLSLILIKSY